MFSQVHNPIIFYINLHVLYDLSSMRNDKTFYNLCALQCILDLNYCSYQIAFKRENLEQNRSRKFSNLYHLPLRCDIRSLDDYYKFHEWKKCTR